jgi:hypothetical protein
LKKERRREEKGGNGNFERRGEEGVRHDEAKLG